MMRRAVIPFPAERWFGLIRPLAAGIVERRRAAMAPDTFVRSTIESVAAALVRGGCDAGELDRQLRAFERAVDQELRKLEGAEPDQRRSR